MTDVAFTECDLPGCDNTYFERGWVVNTGRTDTVTSANGKDITVPIIKVFCSEVHVAEAKRIGVLSAQAEHRVTGERILSALDEAIAQGPAEDPSAEPDVPDLLGALERSLQPSANEPEPGDESPDESLPWDDPSADPVGDVREAADRIRSRGATASIRFEERDIPPMTDEEIALLHGCQCEITDLRAEAYTLTITEGSPNVIHDACGHHLGGFEPDEYEAEGIPVTVTPHVERTSLGEVDCLWLEITPVPAPPTDAVRQARVDTLREVLGVFEHALYEADDGMDVVRALREFLTRALTEAPETAAEPGPPAPHPSLFLLVCRECAADDGLVMPFATQAERGRWATAHTDGTGHDRWWVVDPSSTPTAGAGSAIDEEARP